MTIPSGIITIWSGAIVNIPAGWHLCDGTAGTPDLRDRFIVGAGNAYAPAATGGSVTHTHPFTSLGHYHTFPAGFGIMDGVDYDINTTGKTVSGTTNPGSSIPPWYALAYIMKT